MIDRWGARGVAEGAAAGKGAGTDAGASVTVGSGARVDAGAGAGADTAARTMPKAERPTTAAATAHQPGAPRRALDGEDTTIGSVIVGRA
jgi:hypothetical protein